MTTSTAAKLGAAGLLILIVIAVVLQNREETTVKLLFATVSMPLAALLTIIFVLGFGLGLLVVLLVRRGSGDDRSRNDRRKP